MSTRARDTADVVEDVNDALGSKVPFAYGTATPSTTVEGFVWYDENDTPPTPKFWDGSAFVPFPSGVSALTVADVTGTTGTVTTNAYTDSGTNYTAYSWTASGSITVAQDGFVDVLIVAGGGGGGVGAAYFGGAGGAGGYVEMSWFITAGTYNLQVGAGGAGASNGADSWMVPSSGIGGWRAFGGGRGANSPSSGGSVNGVAGGSGGGGSGFSTVGGAAIFDGIQGHAGGGTGNTSAGGGGAGGAASGQTRGPGKASSISGSSVTYAEGGPGNTTQSGAANTGNGSGRNANAGGSGIVIVRVRT